MTVTYCTHVQSGICARCAEGFYARLEKLEKLRESVEGQAGQCPESLSIRVRYALSQLKPKG